MHYDECPTCGANLDPGERCDGQTAHDLRTELLALLSELPEGHPIIVAVHDYLFSQKEEAAQDAGTSTDGTHNRAEALQYLDSIMVGPVRQMEG